MAHDRPWSAVGDRRSWSGGNFRAAVRPGSLLALISPHPWSMVDWALPPRCGTISGTGSRARSTCSSTIRCPGAVMPPLFSFFPAYPYGIPLMAVVVSLIVRARLEAAGPLVNVLALSVETPSSLKRSLSTSCARPPASDGDAAPRSPAAVAITVLRNPGLDGEVVPSTYADSASWSRSAHSACSRSKSWRGCRASEPGNAEDFGLVLRPFCATLVNLKQANSVLLRFDHCGPIASWRCAIAMRTWRAAPLLARTPGAAIIVMVAWRYYVALNLTNAEKSIQPSSDGISRTWGRPLNPSVTRYVNAPVFNGPMWLVTGPASWLSSSCRAR